jgi:hypothetical protein
VFAADDGLVERSDGERLTRQRLGGRGLCEDLNDRLRNSDRNSDVAYLSYMICQHQVAWMVERC